MPRGYEKPFSPVPKRKPLEIDVQAWAVEYLRVQYRAMTCSVPDAFSTRKGRIKSARKGYLTGWPDTFVAEPRGKAHGLFLEFKRGRNNKLSEAQIKVKLDLESRGYVVMVPHGIDEAREMIDRYFLGGG